MFTPMDTEYSKYCVQCAYAIKPSEFKFWALRQYFLRAQNNKKKNLKVKILYKNWYAMAN